MQQGVDVSHAGPVPAGRAGQHLGEAAGVVLPTVKPVVPQELVIGPLQPGDGVKTDGVGTRMGWYLEKKLNKDVHFHLDFCLMGLFDQIHPSRLTQMCHI